MTPAWIVVSSSQTLSTLLLQESSEETQSLVQRFFTSGVVQSWPGQCLLAESVMSLGCKPTVYVGAVTEQVDCSFIATDSSVTDGRLPEC
jgi:hypothetical protein